MNVNFRKYTALSICLLLTAGLCLGSFGAVLCVDGDGKVKVEPICQKGCCDDEQQCPSAATEEHKDHQEGCSDCSDLQLDEPGWSRRPSSGHDTQFDHIPIIQATYVLPLSNDDIQPVAVASVDTPSPVEPPITAILSSTILRC